MASTDDVCRRIMPRTLSPHLVSSILFVAQAAGGVLLCDHRLSGLSLATGDHVEPRESPVETVRREPDERELHTARWWTPEGLHDAHGARGEPHLLRALDALGLAR